MTDRTSPPTPESRRLDERIDADLLAGLRAMTLVQPETSGSAGGGSR